MDKLVYGNTNRLLYIGPCKLNRVTIAGDGAGGDLQVYDGSSAKDKQILHLEILTGTTFEWTSRNGISISFGIYIVVNAATTKYAVEYEVI